MSISLPSEKETAMGWRFIIKIWLLGDKTQPVEMTRALKVETVNDKEYHEKTTNQLNEILPRVWLYTASHHLLVTDILTKSVWNLDRFLHWLSTIFSY